MDAEEISLGFMTAERRVPRWFFPSKVGGLPTWQAGPPPANLFCTVCSPQVPLTLLVQIYAPVDGLVASFHRSLYVFCCLSCGGHFRAVSSHLPRENDEYPSFALSNFFASKKEFWRLWQQQQLEQKVNTCNNNSSSTSDTSATAAIMAPSRGTSGDTHGQAQTIDEATKAAVIRLLQRGERLRQVCCCPVCGLSGGDVVSETEHAAAVELLQQQLLRNERRLQVLLRQQQEEAAEAAESDEETDPSGVVDLDSTEFEFEDTEADQRGLLLLDGVHIKAGRVLHPRCLKRLKFGSVFVAFPEFPLSAETEELGNKESSANETLEAALERLGLAGDNEPLSHEEELLKQYQQTIKETPEADLDESETDAFEEIYQQHTSQDPQLEVFLKRCGRPHQKGHVVRYAQGGTPLWPFSKGQIKPAEVPPCACGAKRQFEFQVQPHLISQLAERVGLHDPAGVASVERLSFGLVAVYSCSAHCSSLSTLPRGYREEFVYAQPDPFYG
ncbi:uncharacterized protein LOC34618080 [Cyclospora cayetanensis]|uniref:Uncharacterized protein LOC34618080 n=1 Tax=Cyclospora cayetanensis TaxID=88456 RepID=A0A6P6RUD1_9EIME|nr:uncharacterized protein LOC34618080 [Cyclospora cayetanensis]